jgi:hypothetical protein
VYVPDPLVLHSCVRRCVVTYWWRVQGADEVTTLSCGIDDLYKTHTVVDDELLSIRVLYCRIIGLRMWVRDE